VPKDRDAVFIHRVPVHPRGIVVSLLGVLKSAGRARVRFGDLAFRASPRRCDERERHFRATRRLVDDSRNAIRCYNAWTFIDSLFRLTCYGPAWLACKRDANTPLVRPEHKPITLVFQRE
jgi:hypothetical protein